MGQLDIAAIERHFRALNAQDDLVRNWKWLAGRAEIDYQRLRYIRVHPDRATVVEAFNIASVFGLTVTHILTTPSDPAIVHSA